MRIGPGVAALNNKIYVTGGYAGQPQSGVDCYDPDTNTWSSKADMNIARSGHILVSLPLLGLLYAIGGCDGDDSVTTHSTVSSVDSIEVYDPDCDTWTLLKHKLNGRVTLNLFGIIKQAEMLKSHEIKR